MSEEGQECEDVAGICPSLLEEAKAIARATEGC
jgi:hypothetical protein